MISESGGAYTWSENAHELRLTPWYDDPVSDQSGEAIYLRDEETGQFWSPTPLPARGAAPYVTRHGFGYSVFEHSEHGIGSELWVYVATDAAVKCSVLKLRNLSDRPRSLSATAYVEWVLGDLAAKSAMHVITELDLVTGALFARNRYNGNAGPRTAFLYAEGAGSVTGDRTEFLGRNGSAENPVALRRIRLSGRTSAGLDPCGAVQVPFTLAPGEERDVVFTLGLGRDTDDARNLVHRFRGTAASRVALEHVWEHWNRVLGTVQVETSDLGLNLLTNGWLTYQTLVAGSGRAPATTSRAARSASGISSRTSWLAARRAAAGKTASGSRSWTAVRRGGRAALVASAIRTRRANSLLRRFSLAAPGIRPLRQDDGRRRRAGRVGARSSRAARCWRQRTRTTTCRSSRARRRASTSTASARSGWASDWGNAAYRSWAPATGTMA